jgi:hypothetical protein
VDYAKDHEIVVSMGSLFPATDSPLFRSLSADEVSRLKGTITVEMDGKTVLQARSEFYGSSPQQVEIGANRIHASSCGQSFTGTISQPVRFWPISYGSSSNIVGRRGKWQ